MLRLNVKNIYTIVKKFYMAINFVCGMPISIGNLLPFIG